MVREASACLTYRLGRAGGSCAGGQDDGEGFSSTEGKKHGTG